jgi:hypothetical protein
VDLASAALSEIILNSVSLDLVYHLENPIRQPWSEVLDTLASELGVDEHHRVPFAEWLKEVKRTPEEGNRAAALAEFFEQDFVWMSGGGVILSTETSRRDSPTLRRVGPVQAETIRRYIEYWRSIGFIRQLPN